MEIIKNFPLISHSSHKIHPMSLILEFRVWQMVYDCILFIMGGVVDIWSTNWGCVPGNVWAYFRSGWASEPVSSSGSLWTELNWTPKADLGFHFWTKLIHVLVPILVSILEIRPTLQSCTSSKTVVWSPVQFHKTQNMFFWEITRFNQSLMTMGEFLYFPKGNKEIAMSYNDCCPLKH